MSDGASPMGLVGTFFSHCHIIWCINHIKIPFIFTFLENYNKNTKAGQKPAGGEARNDKQLPALKQRDGESNYKFMRRINIETSNAHEEAKFEAKYGVEVVRDKKTGAIKLKKRPRNEIDERIKQNLENHKRAKRGQKMQPNKVMAPEQKKQLIKQAMAEQKEKENETKAKVVEEFKRDEFKFGEVVMAPPQLPVPRRAQKAETVSRVRIFNKSHLSYETPLNGSMHVYKIILKPL